MLTGTFNLGSDESRADTWNSQRQGRTATFFAFTDMRISKIGVEFCSYGTYETAVTIGVSVDGVSVFSEEIPMPLGETHEFTYFYVDTNISVGLGQTVTISGTTGANGTGVYHGTAGSMIYPWGQMTGSDNLAVEMTTEYAAIWLVDGQNDGYAYPIGTDPTEFAEFAKDEFGYPKNWGVWKLDDNNEGYPWPTGYEDYIVRGLPVKIMSQDKTHWINSSVGVFTDEKIINAYVKLIGDDEDADNGNAVDPEQVFATTDTT